MSIPRPDPNHPLSGAPTNAEALRKGFCWSCRTTIVEPGPGQTWKICENCGRQFRISETRVIERGPVNPAWLGKPVHPSPGLVVVLASGTRVAATPDTAGEYWMPRDAVFLETVWDIPRERPRGVQ